MADPDAGREAGKRTDRSLLLWGIVVYGACAVLVAAGAVFLPDLFDFRVLPGDVPSAVAQCGLGLAAGGLIIAASWAIVFKTSAGRDLAGMQAMMVESMSLPDALLLALTAGVVEEALFRGALWTLVSAYIGPWGALSVTSVLFGVAHGAFRRGYVLWSLMALASGVVAGLLVIWTGTLLAPMVMHVLIDAVDLPLLKKVFRTSDGE